MAKTKRSPPAPSKAGNGPTSQALKYSPSVFFLDGADEDAQIQEAFRRSLEESYNVLSAASPPPKRARRTTSSVSTPGAGGKSEVINLLSDEEDNDMNRGTDGTQGVGGNDGGDDSGGGKLGAVDGNLTRNGRNGRSKSPRRKSPRTPMQREVSISSSSDDVVVLSAPESPAVEIVTGPPAPSISSARQSGPKRGHNGGIARRNKGISESQKEIDEEEVEAVGVVNSIRLPHMRQHCTEHRFVQDVMHKQSMKSKSAAVRAEIKDGMDSNRRHCDLCYCFVCDILAGECEHWVGTKPNNNDHCLASDQGADTHLWKRMREQKKSPAKSAGTGEARNSSLVTNAQIFGAATTTLDTELETFMRASTMRRSTASMRLTVEMVRRNMDLQRRLQGILENNSDSDNPLGVASFPTSVYRVGAGPWEQVDKATALRHKLTQCRKCRWYCAFQHMDFNRKKRVHPRFTLVPNPHPVGELDWCHACGRVADKRDFGKEQAGKDTPPRGTRKESNIFLGTKTITFRIRSHDPRKIDQFKDRWARLGGKSPEWVLNEAEMQEDTFRHRFGKRPTVSMILASIPIVKESSLPNSGVVPKAVSYEHLSRSCLGERDVAASETEVRPTARRTPPAALLAVI